MITVGIDCIVELLCADRPKAHMVQMVLYREKIPYTPYKGKRRKVLKVNTFIMIAGMLWTNVNTGFFGYAGTGGAVSVQYKRCQFQKVPGLPGC